VDLRERAEANLERHLKRNPYPGRGLVIGRSAGDDAWLLVYWIMGRSASSQSRRFVADGAVLRTEPTDPDKLERPELTIYEAMWDLPGLHLVTNGDQTRTLRDVLSRSGSFEEALALREREPDAPHYTPRIAGLLDLRSEPGLALGILKASAADPEKSDRFAYRPALPPPGLGLGLTTYAGDGDPLPSFVGEPLWLPLEAGAEATLERFWDALDPGNRVAIAVKAVSQEGVLGPIAVRNRHP
jgi:hypothetical protein